MPKGIHKNHARGTGHYRWNDGKIISSHGYVKLRLGVGHELADPNGYAYEHLVVWMNAGNERPNRKQVLHHVNGDKTDNRLDNLQLMNRGRHTMDEHLDRDPKTGRLRRKS